MKRRIILALCLSLSVGLAAAAEERATKDEAVAFVNRAVAYVKANGKDKALAEFNEPKGKFVDRELYIVVVDLQGTVLANGANRRVVGKNLLQVKDLDGKFFVKEEIEVATSKGNGWVEFRWNNPVTSKMEMRQLYLVRKDDYLISSGVFKP